MNFKMNGKASRRVMSLVLVLAMIISTLSITKPAYAATTITSMSYYSAGDGPVISGSGVKDASYGFVMPIFNGGSATWDDVVDDLHVNVKVDGVWKDIDEVSSFVYNSNWGHWHDAGFTGYWFKVGETTELQLASKANPNVTLNYTLQFTKLAAAEITSMSFTQGPILTAGITGGSGFTYPTFNGDSAIKYEQVADDLKVFVKTVDDTDWIDIDNNAASGWIYDQNFGQFWDGPGGYWFTVTKTTYVRLQSKSNPGVFLDYTINFEKVKRNSYTLTPEGSTNLTADENGAVGIVLPKIDGGFPYQDELDAYVYEILINGEWVPLADSYYSGYMYQASGYRKSSPSNQWGYWVDNIYGLWFQPVTVDTVIRVGYPTDGVKGHDCGNNYVQFNFTGNPDAPRPDPADYENIELGSATDYSIDGWNLIWNDEFDGNALDTSKWTNQTGYYLNDDPGTWGWGNAELEYYTDSTKNTFVSDGKLTLRLLDEPATFPQDPTRVAPYSSGKVISQNKFSFKYGRIDYCAKLPTGAGIWPALWMMPNDEIYGTWASSGEIDVMEARGRVPNTVCGTIHYGGAWPGNTNSGEDYHFPEGSTFDDGFHVYSCVWSKENIKWYVDGNCYSVINYTDWYSNNAIDNPYAPFDQEFYVIMNLAAGGWFDGGIAPDASSIPCEMQVEYVRVYQAEGDTTGSYRNNGGGSISTPDPTQPSEEPTQPSEEPTVEPTESDEEPTVESIESDEEPTVESTESNEEPTESSSEESGVVIGEGYVYDAATGKVTVTYEDATAGSAIIYIAQFNNEADAVAAYNEAVAGLPGITLPGHIGAFMTSANGVHTYTFDAAEGSYFVYATNGIGGAGFSEKWIMGQAKSSGTVVTPTEPSEESSEDPTESSEENTDITVTGNGYVYDSVTGKVTVTYEDAAADSAIIYIAQFNNEADAVAAYNEAVAGLPGITLPGHIGVFMTSANGVHTYTFDAAEGSYFIYGTNGLGGAGFGEKWIMGQAKEAEVVVPEPEPTETDPEVPTETESESESESEEPVIVAPVKVQNVKGTYEDGKIVLTWDNCGAESYIVKRMTTGESAYTVLTESATADGWVDTQDVVTNKEYYYRVYGCFRDADGNLKEGPASDLLTISVGNPPKKVTGAVAEFKDGKIVLNWDDVGAEKYKITRYDDTRKTYVNLTFNAKAANGYVDEDIIEAERYCYRISGYFRDADGKLVSGELSDTIWVVATDKEPAKVMNVNASVSGNAVTLTWDAADGARFYKISRAAGESGSGYETRGSLITATTYTDKVAAAGTYRYKVVGYYIEPSGTWHYGTMSSTLFVKVK